MDKILILAAITSFFSFVICSTGFGLGLEEVSIREDELYKKLYSKSGDGDVLKPSETLNVLKTLDQKYKNRDDAESLKIHESIVDLINAGDMNEEKCLYFYMEYSILRRSHSTNENYPNIINYINHNKDTLFSMCKEPLLAKLRQDVKQLPDYVEGFFELLRESMLEADHENQIRHSIFLISDDRILQEGIINYLRLISAPLFPRASDKENGYAYFKVEYDLSVKYPCYLVTKKLDSVMSDFFLISQDDNMLEKMHPFAMFWLENFNLCTRITGLGEARSRALGIASYKLLLDIAEKKNKQPEGTESSADETIPAKELKRQNSTFSVLGSLRSCLGLDC